MSEWGVTQTIMNLVAFGIPVGGMVWYLSGKLMALERSINSNTAALTKNEESIKDLTELIHRDREDIVWLKYQVEGLERRVERLEDFNGGKD